MRDEIRRYGRSPELVEVAPELNDFLPSQVDRILGKQKLERYEAALAQLPEESRLAASVSGSRKLAGYGNEFDALGARRK